MGIRNVYSIPTDVRFELDQLIDQCAAENGGILVGNPSVSYKGEATRLEVDDHFWWNETMRVRYPQFVLMSVNRITHGKRAEPNAT